MNDNDVMDNTVTWLDIGLSSRQASVYDFKRPPRFG